VREKLEDQESEKTRLEDDGHDETSPRLRRVLHLIDNYTNEENIVLDTIEFYDITIYNPEKSDIEQQRAAGAAKFKEINLSYYKVGDDVHKTAYHVLESLKAKLEIQEETIAPGGGFKGLTG
jgi:hypothetical protein